MTSEQRTAAEAAAEWFRSAEVGTRVAPHDRARGIGIVEYLRDDGFVVVQINEETRERMVEAMATVRCPFGDRSLVASRREVEGSEKTAHEQWANLCSEERIALDAALGVLIESQREGT